MTIGRIRFAGVSTGSVTFIGAWFVAAAIARLTGAAAVLLLLAAAVVGFGAAYVSARRDIARIAIGDVDVARLTSVGVPTPATLQFAHPAANRDGVFRVFDGTRPLAIVPFDALDERGMAHVELTFGSAGIVDRLRVDVASAGPAGLVWMHRSSDIRIAPVAVAPVPQGPSVDVGTTPSSADGFTTAASGPRHGDVDGVRVWRDGDGDSSVHWPSTLRSGSLVVHDRQSTLDEQWIIECPTDDVDESVAARITHTLLDGLRSGHHVVLRRPGQADATVTNPDHAREFGAALIGIRVPPRDRSVAWFRRSLRIRAAADVFTSVDPWSRWLTASSSLLALGMLIGALGTSSTTIGIAAAGLVVGTVVSLRCAVTGSRPWWLQLLVGAATLGALAYIASTVGGIGGLLEALRGPMPDLLMLLLVIHGFEVVDRRTLRVHQAIGAVIIAYATGLRIDDRVGWWMAAWAVVFTAAVRSTNRRRSARLARQPFTTRTLARPVMALTAAIVSTLAILSVVPVPDGPARLGLPALSNDAPSAPVPGGLASPSGDAPAPSDGTRGALGEVGGYPGFTESMDTSVRGDLGDELVMRVRSPKPDFWRGQTFTDFDGRIWTVSPETGQRRDGPQIDVPATIGDVPRPDSDLEVEDLIQTYYIEADLPNVVFAAARPDVVTIDGSLYTRPDGALRSDVTLNSGSVYTVVSRRVQVTAESLRAQGDVAEFFAGVVDDARRELLAPYLEIPASTTQRTLDLATELRPPSGGTYDTIMAYQNWLSLHTEYDVNAPVPDAGADAVDDYLFVSQQGFCEQIASALAVMLRTQGVPTRIATGYVPGERDTVSGVFEVRASDAHAWVEVWFPDSGWQAFDPTASVPLSGDAGSGSVGGDLVSAAISGVASRPVETGLLVALGSVLLGGVRALGAMLHRRRRGRWGVLQDRFTATAPGALTNPERAAACDDDAAHDARDLAALLDRAAFDPTWDDSDADYAAAKTALAALEQRVGA